MKTTQTQTTPAGYSPTRFPGPIDLDLSRNEGECCLSEADRIASLQDPSSIDRYPNTTDLETLIAKRFDVAPERVLVTAGGDDAIERLCRLTLTADAANNSTALIHTPTFEMIELYCSRMAQIVKSVPWLDGAFPIDETSAALTQGCSLLALVSPNNPTGGVIPTSTLRRLVDQAKTQRTPVLIDLAYVEFADQDPTDDLLQRDNVVVVRTFSKAWGLAGLRVGYALGDPDVIVRMRDIGNPYAVSGPSLALATKALRSSQSQMSENVKRARESRQSLTKVLQSCKAQPIPGQANFVPARFNDAPWVRDALAGLGIAVRAFPSRPGLNDTLRITGPLRTTDQTRLNAALETATKPQALLFDLDGVIADVSRSYRHAIIETASTFGVTINEKDVALTKNQGGFNNDWQLTQHLLEQSGLTVDFDRVQTCFESIYQGDDARPGLKERESLIPSREWLSSLASRYPLAIVTGRPRADADEFLTRFDIRSLFSAVVTLEDAPAKPDPAPVTRALDSLNVTRAWMIGDTVDDICAARSANVIPIGIIAPGADTNANRAALAESGAARILSNLEQIEELLP